MWELTVVPIRVTVVVFSTPSPNNERTDFSNGHFLQYRRLSFCQQLKKQCICYYIFHLFTLLLSRPSHAGGAGQPVHLLVCQRRRDCHVRILAELCLCSLLALHGRVSSRRPSRSSFVEGRISMHFPDFGLTYRLGIRNYFRFPWRSFPLYCE